MNLNKNILCKETQKNLKILEKYDLKKSKPKMSYKITDNIFFMKLYNNIKTILKSINIKNNTIKISELKTNPNKYLKDNEFTSKNITDNIITHLKYSYKIVNDNNTIIYFTKKQISKSPLIIYHIFTIITLLKILFNRYYGQSIIYFETSEKKRFPKKNNILGPNEVNSGLTFIDLHKNGDIILYRKEELLKVLIHELIHSNLIDEKIIFSDLGKKFSDLFCVDYRILLNEAFTESFATIINLFYINIKLNLKKKNLNVMFFNELKYSNYICSKILKYYNITKIGDIIKNNNNCAKKFPQKTNVFSYYILKNILLNNHIKFGNILENFTKNYKIIDTEGIILIIDLIKNNIDKLDSYTYNILNDKNNSLRLTLYEIKT